MYKASSKQFRWTLSRGNICSADAVMKAVSSNRADLRKPSGVILATRYLELQKLRELVRKAEMRVGARTTFPEAS
jgi:hypothetical protein